MDERETVSVVAEKLHALGVENGDCTAGKTGLSDHGPEAHFADARYVIGCPPVSNPDHLEDLNKGGDELRLLRKRYVEGDL